MQQQEARPRSGGAFVARVQTVDAVCQRGDQIVVARHVLAQRVRPVAQQGEVKMAFGIGEVVHLEPIELLLDVGAARDQRWHHHERSELGRHARGELELREPRGRKQRRDQAIDDRHRDVRGGDQAGEPQKHEARWTRAESLAV